MALRQTKNLNLKSIDKLVYVFITILKGIFGTGFVLLSLAFLLINWLILCRVFQIFLFDGAASFY